MTVMYCLDRIALGYCLGIMPHYVGSTQILLHQGSEQNASIHFIEGVVHSGGPDGAFLPLTSLSVFLHEINIAAITAEGILQLFSPISSLAAQWFPILHQST